MDIKEQSFVTRLREGDENAYHELFSRYYGLLCHIANLYLHDDFAAETVVDDTIFHFWEVREQVHITTSLESFLSQSVRHRCLDYLKSRYHQTERPVSSMPNQTGEVSFHQHADAETPLSELLNNELEERVLAAVDALPSECKRVFTLSRFEGKSNQEIATLLNISINTVKYHIKNAIRQLRVLLRDYLLCAGLLLFLH